MVNPLILKPGSNKHKCSLAWKPLQVYLNVSGPVAANKWGLCFNWWKRLSWIQSEHNEEWTDQRGWRQRCCCGCRRYWRSWAGPGREPTDHRRRTWTRGGRLRAGPEVASVSGLPSVSSRPASIRWRFRQAGPSLLRGTKQRSLTNSWPWKQIGPSAKLFIIANKAYTEEWWHNSSKHDLEQLVFLVSALVVTGLRKLHQTDQYSLAKVCGTSCGSHVMMPEAGYV